MKEFNVLLDIKPFINCITIYTYPSLRQDFDISSNSIKFSQNEYIFETINLLPETSVTNYLLCENLTIIRLNFKNKTSLSNFYRNFQIKEDAKDDPKLCAICGNNFLIGDSILVQNGALENTINELMYCHVSSKTIKGCYSRMPFTYRRAGLRQLQVDLVQSDVLLCKICQAEVGHYNSKFNNCYIYSYPHNSTLDALKFSNLTLETKDLSMELIYISKNYNWTSFSLYYQDNAEIYYINIELPVKINFISVQDKPNINITLSVKPYLIVPFIKNISLHNRFDPHNTSFIRISSNTFHIIDHILNVNIRSLPSLLKPATSYKYALLCCDEKAQINL